MMAFISDTTGYDPASVRILLDTRRFSSEVGFKSIILSRKRRNLLEFYIRLLKFWPRASVVLCIYPYICEPVVQTHNPLRLFEINILALLISFFNRKKLSILYIVDLPIEQSMAFFPGIRISKISYNIERRILSSFDILCVFNDWMERQIRLKYKLSKNRFVQFEILDYGIHTDIWMPKKGAQNAWRIAYVTSGMEDGQHTNWIRQLPSSSRVKYVFFGKGGEWINTTGREDFLYIGFLSSRKLAACLSEEAEFGLVCKGFQSDVVEYHAFGSTSKFSAYLTAGLPILVPSEYSYVAALVRKYQIGFTFNSLNDIPTLLSRISWEEYLGIRDNCIRLGKEISQGSFFKKAVSIALGIVGLIHQS